MTSRRRSDRAEGPLWIGRASWRTSRGRWDQELLDIAGITIHPNEPWMKQMARNVTMEGCGILRDCRYLLHDRDTKYTQAFRAICFIHASCG